MKLLNTILCLGAICLFSCNKGSDDTPTVADHADGYVGNYILTDTITHLDFNNQTIVEFSTSGATIAKVNATMISSPKLFKYSCGNDTAVVGATSLALSTFCSGLSNVICTKSGSTLIYTYQAYVGTTFYIKGKAVKQ